VASWRIRSPGKDHSRMPGGVLGMILVLDTSAFFAGIPLEGELCTVPEIAAEIRDIAARCRFETLVSAGLLVREPSAESFGPVDRAAAKTGDAPVLSAADRGLLALAYEVKGTVVSDDFAVRNVAAELGLPVRPVLQRPSTSRVWRFRCTGCGRYYDKPGECPVCGAEVKRKLK
jgi:UPF0271 protein